MKMKGLAMTLLKNLTKIGEDRIALVTNEMPPSKTNNLQEESEPPSPILYFEIGPVNGQMRPVIIQWEGVPFRSRLGVTIYNNVDTMGLTTAP